jgi:beta-lactam-binding protein with PASTA domain
VIPPKQIWLGRPKDRPIRVTATPVGEDQPQPPRPATFRQRSWLPWWLAVVAPIAAAVAAAVILLLPKQTLVPDLKGKTVAAAEKLLITSGLKLSPPYTPVRDQAVPAGSIVDQTPAPKKKVKRGSVVLVSVAVGPAKIPVPPVTGVAPATAAVELAKVGLQLGMVSPPHDTATIVSQIPAPGQPVAKGTPVDVFLPPPPPGSQTSTSATTGSTKPAAQVQKPVTLPVISGNPMVAAQRLSALGFVPVAAAAFSAQPPGMLVTTNPPAGTSVPPGGKVQLITSAGWPTLSYDNGNTIFLAGAPGTAATKLPASGQHLGEASWSPDGTTLVYVQGPANLGQLMAINPGQPGAQPSPLTSATSDDHDPAFAPSTSQKVLAFIDDSNGASKLCFAVAGPSMLNPACTGHPGWKLGNQIAWSPDGSKVLVLGIKNGSGGNVFGLIEFSSNVPYSTQASLWGHGQVVTDISKPQEGVIAGAFSPDGKQVALISNIGNSGFHLFLAPPTDFLLAPPAKALAVRACQVAWRSDSRYLAVMQADSACQMTFGDIVGIDLSTPDTSTPIATVGEDPAWQPRSLGG